MGKVDSEEAWRLLVEAGMARLDMFATGWDAAAVAYEASGAVERAVTARELAQWWRNVAIVGKGEIDRALDHA